MVAIKRSSKKFSRHMRFSQIKKNATSTTNTAKTDLKKGAEEVAWKTCSVDCSAWAADASSSPVPKRANL